MRVAVIGWGQQTNAELTAAWRWLGLDARLPGATSIARALKRLPYPHSLWVFRTSLP